MWTVPKVQHSECDPVGCSEWASEVPVQRMRTHVYSTEAGCIIKQQVCMVSQVGARQADH